MSEGRRVRFRIRDPATVKFRIGDVPAAKFTIGNPVIKTSDQYPAYEGPYNVTPTAVAQVLQTRNRSLTDFVVVAPIPSNYGLITYRGNIITVS